MLSGMLSCRVRHHGVIAVTEYQMNSARLYAYPRIRIAGHGSLCTISRFSAAITATKWHRAAEDE